MAPTLYQGMSSAGNLARSDGSQGPGPGTREDAWSWPAPGDQSRGRATARPRFSPDGACLAAGASRLGRVASTRGACGATRDGSARWREGIDGAVRFGSVRSTGAACRPRAAGRRDEGVGAGASRTWGGRLRISGARDGLSVDGASTCGRTARPAVGVGRDGICGSDGTRDGKGIRDRDGVDDGADLVTGDSRRGIVGTARWLLSRSGVERNWPPAERSGGALAAGSRGRTRRGTATEPRAAPAGPRSPTDCRVIVCGRSGPRYRSLNCSPRGGRYRPRCATTMPALKLRAGT